MGLNNVDFSVAHGVVGNLDMYDFYISDSIISSSLTKKDGTKRTRVPGISLNNFLTKISPSMLIIDIEGGEI